MSSIALTVSNLIEPAVTELGYELVEVEYKKRHNEYNLTIYIHSVSGVITLDDCEKVHRAIDGLLDTIEDVFDGGYTLNVSSLGLDRPLKVKSDFERNMGKLIDIKLYVPIDNKKSFTGILKDYDDDAIVIEVDGKELKFKKSKVALAQQHVEFKF